MYPERFWCFIYNKSVKLTGGNKITTDISSLEWYIKCLKVLTKHIFFLI